MKVSPFCYRNHYETRVMENLPTFFEYEGCKLAIEAVDDRINVYVPSLQYRKNV